MQTGPHLSQPQPLSEHRRGAVEARDTAYSLRIFRSNFAGGLGGCGAYERQYGGALLSQPLCGQQQVPQIAHPALSTKDSAADPL